MTVKETEILKDLKGSIKNMSEKLFGNGTRNGCIDQRLENVENYMSELREIMPKMVTESSCSKRHEIRWTRVMLIIGLIATWSGLFLKVMEVI